MCATCARVARGAASPDFARILLQRQRERSMRMLRGARFAFALVAPGAGMVMARRVWRALALLALGALLVTAWPGTTWPYAARPRVGITTDPWGLDWLIPLAFIYLLSIGAYLAERARAARAEHALGRSLRTRRSVSTRVDETPSQQEVA